MKEPLTKEMKPPRVEWSEQLGEWIVVVDDIGYRYYFDCKAEADEYVRLVLKYGQDSYIWRNLDKWFKNHKHNFECKPHWVRGTNGNAN